MAALAEVAAKTYVCIFDRDEIIAPLAAHKELRAAVRADVNVVILVCFILWQGLAAIFTFYSFHRALCYRVVKSPDLIKALEIKDAE